MPGWARLVFCLLGVLAILAGANIFLKNQQTSQWKTVKGRVISSAIAGIDEDFIEIEYQYRVNGVEYRGDRFTVSRGSVGNAATLVKRNRPGAVVDVLYNPRDPGECALARDPIFVPIFFASVGTIFLLVGLFASF
ncbi:MAG: DUF3592 domain-containing protein [Cyanobacteria bacterium J06639_1]